MNQAAFVCTHGPKSHPILHRFPALSAALTVSYLQRWDGVVGAVVLWDNYADDLFGLFGPVQSALPWSKVQAGPSDTIDGEKNNVNSERGRRTSSGKSYAVRDPPGFLRSLVSFCHSFFLFLIPFFHFILYLLLWLCRVCSLTSVVMNACLLCMQSAADVNNE